MVANLCMLLEGTVGAPKWDSKPPVLVEHRPLGHVLLPGAAWSSQQQPARGPADVG